MEIIVATMIFAVVVSALMTMFNYVLKINRRTEALRQASQGMRDLMETIVKEVRNGQIDYAVVNGTSDNNNSFYANVNNPCRPSNLPLVGAGPSYPVKSTYPVSGGPANRLAILTSENNYVCFYLGEGPGNTNGPGNTTLPVGSKLSGAAAGSFAAVLPSNPKPVLALQKNVLPLEVLTPPNVSVQNLVFLVKPTCDPYAPNCTDYINSYPKIQPQVTIIAKFRVILPTGEQTDIDYQTTVSSSDYNIPH